MRTETYFKLALNMLFTANLGAGSLSSELLLVLVQLLVSFRWGKVYKKVCKVDFQP